MKKISIMIPCYNEVDNVEPISFAVVNVLERELSQYDYEIVFIIMDVTFREDTNTTIDKQAAQNQNIIRKWSLSILKMIEIMKPGLSLKKKRFAISLRPIQYLEEVLSF